MNKELQLAIDVYCAHKSCNWCPMNLGPYTHICCESTRNEKEEYVNLAIEALHRAGYKLSFVNTQIITEKDVLSVFSE